MQALPDRYRWALDCYKKRRRAKGVHLSRGLAMRLLAIFAFTASALAACTGQKAPAPDEAKVEKPLVRLAAVPGRPAAGYFDISVGAGRGALTGVSSPQAGRIEMHETMTGAGMTSMHALDRVAPKEGQIRFEPGGKHLMIFDVDPKIAPGGTIQLRFQFEKLQPVTAEARVVAAGDDAGR
jgi:copper(I)-binding protein